MNQENNPYASPMSQCSRLPTEKSLRFKLIVIGFCCYSSIGLAVDLFRRGYEIGCAIAIFVTFVTWFFSLNCAGKLGNWRKQNELVESNS